MLFVPCRLSNLFAPLSLLVPYRSKRIGVFQLLRFGIGQETEVVAVDIDDGCSLAVADGQDDATLASHALDMAYHASKVAFDNLYSLAWLEGVL